jgi:hypothetical protein
MSQTPNGQPAPPQSLFPSAGRLRIAELAPEKVTESQTSPYVEAVISLVLDPYSKRKESLSLLLAEPDVRLRRAKGQLKVTFQGPAAQQVTRSELNIGDVILLRIDHAEWRDTGDAVATPGKKIQWDLHFKKRVVLEARRDGGHLALVDYKGSDTLPPYLEASASQIAKSKQASGFRDNTSIAFSTPAHRKSKRASSGSFMDASLDPFADDDGFVLGKGRKRTKYGRMSGSWRLLGEGENSDHGDELEVAPEDAVAKLSEENLSRIPPKSNGSQDVIMLDNESSPEASPTEPSMPPPLLPYQRSPESVREASPQTERLVSPRLRPLASPGLPMVSPLVRNGRALTSYFDVHSTATSELDAISVSSTIPQELMTSSKPAGEERFGPGLLEEQEQPPKSPQRKLPHSQPNPDFADGEEYPQFLSKEMFEMQPSAFGNPIATSPFGLALNEFPGFISQPISVFPSADFGACTAQSSFAMTSTPSGTAAKFPSFGNASAFGNPYGSGMGVDFGTTTPATDIDTGTPAVSQGAVASHEQLDGEAEKQLSQDMGEQGNEYRATRSHVHSESKSSRRERELSEDDDDMYGSARPKVQTPSLRSVESGRSESISTNGKELPDAGMFDADEGKVPPVAFPSPRDWNSTTQIKPRRLRQSPFLDGASDEMSEYETSDHDAAAAEEYEGAETPMSSESLELVMSVEARDLDVVDIVSSTSGKETTTFESITRAQIVVGPVLELEGIPVPQMQEDQRFDMHTTDGDDKVDDLLAAESELEDVEAVQNDEEQHLGSPQTHEGVSRLNGDESDIRPEQLLTPDNTQQESLERPSFESLQEVPSLQMPPTPDNTQEPAYADMVSLDGPSESQSTELMQASVDVSLPAPARNVKVDSRPSRTSLTAPILSSPYFTPRRSARLSPERQMQDFETTEVVEELDQEEGMEPRAQVLPARNSARSQSPRHDKRLHNMLGMSTPLSYYTPLPNLDEYFGQQIDIFAICTTDSGVPIRSRVGPKDFNVTLHLADSFLKGAATITAQLFRPYKDALPVVQRGEVILLRSVKVQTEKRKMMLLSTNSSAWAVFSFSGISPKEAEYWDLRIDIVGPPMELGSEENVYAKRLLEWWETDGSLVHKVFSSKDAAPLTRPRTRDGSDKAYATGDEPEQRIQKATNGHVDAYKAQAIDPPRTARSSRRNDENTDNMEHNHQTRGKSAPLSPTFEPTSPTPVRTTRSSRRTVNRTDNTGNDEDSTPADTVEPLSEITSPKISRRTRHSNPISETPEPSSRTLRSQSTVHELRDGTRYVDGHVPTKKDGVHVLRDGTKYFDENISPTGKTPSLGEENLVHELRDGTNYVDRSQSPELRRSARNGSAVGKTPSVREESVVHELRDGTNYVDRANSTDVRRSARQRRGGSLVHELRDGAKYTDE